MIDMTINSADDTSLNNLDLCQCHRVKSKLQLVESFCCKVAQSSQSFLDSRICKGDNCSKVLFVWQIWICF